MKSWIGTLLALALTTALYAAEVDTITIVSKAMRLEARCVVIVPEVEKPAAGWPVLYLLHGYSGNYSNWIQKVPGIKEYADRYGIMVVCPDGGFSSWYLDSPVDSNMRYATYVGEEVPAYIDRHYPTRAEAAGRAITGLSMGGHGGLYLGLRYSSTFGACGSMSGGVDLLCCTTRFDVPQRLGDTLQHAQNWVDYSVMGLVEKIKPAEAPAMIIDCGTEDFFYGINASLHQKLLSLKIPHEYIERPGKHDWNYWSRAIRYQFLFFADYFAKSST